MIFCNFSMFVRLLGAVNRLHVLGLVQLLSGLVDLGGSVLDRDRSGVTELGDSAKHPGNRDLNPSNPFLSLVYREAFVLLQLGKKAVEEGLGLLGDDDRLERVDDDVHGMVVIS